MGFALLGVILPLGALWFDGSVWLLAAIFFVGWGLNGTFPMFMATVPAESVDPRLTATLSGVVIAAGEVLGGVAGPLAGGLLADRFGLSAPIWLMFALTLIAAAPDAAITAFVDSTYGQAATRGGWDRAALERPADGVV